MVILQEGKCTDVVFVVEGNASLGAYFDELKGNYILPTLVHFNGGPLIDSDFTGDYGKTVFSLVVFNSVDCFPGPAISCTAPTSNAKEFMRTLDKILFIGGGGESHSLLAEGLGGAMQIFDHMKIRREAGTKIDRMCILITNSPPFSIPAMECGHYSGYTTEQLAVLMGERNVNLSVMSPRKLGVLQRLYDKSCAELQVVPNKDYAKDERHLILLKGFELQERVPDSKEGKQVPGNASPRRVLPSSGMKNSPGQSPTTKFKVPTTQSIASQGTAQGKYCTWR